MICFHHLIGYLLLYGNLVNNILCSHDHVDDVFKDRTVTEALLLLW